jgi:predicted dehydrogenase
MTKKKIRIALIGTEFMGRAHANAWRQVVPFFEPELEPILKVVCGRDAAKTEAFARRWGFEEFSTDWRTVVEREDVDVVDLSLPQSLQPEVAIAAAKCGKHIFCEKPMALTAEAAEEMFREAEKANVRHYVNYNYRRSPAVSLAKQIIEEGRIGEIRHWRGAYLQDWLVDPKAPIGWKLKKAHAGYGPHGDLNSHSVDLAHFLVGKIDSVYCQKRTFINERPIESGSITMDTVDVDDASQMLVNFDCGALGSFEATRFATGQRNANQFEIFGSQGALRWDLEDLNRLEFYSKEDPSHLRGYRTILVSEPEHPYVGKWWPPGHAIGYEHTFVHAVADFLTAISKGQSISPDFSDGLRVLQVLEAANTSADSGQRVNVMKK